MEGIVTLEGNWKGLADFLLLLASMTGGCRSRRSSTGLGISGSAGWGRNNRRVGFRLGVNWFGSFIFLVILRFSNALEAEPPSFLFNFVLVLVPVFGCFVCFVPGVGVIGGVGSDLAINIGLPLSSNKFEESTVHTGYFEMGSFW